MTTAEAMKLIRDEMSARGVSPARWGFAEGPARMVYLRKAAVGFEQAELPIKRSLNKQRITDWIDQHVRA